MRLFTLSLLLLLSSSAFALLPYANTGNLYISMWTSDEIAVYSVTGEELERFSTPGLDGPRGVAFDPTNGDIWVAGEHSNAIYIFDSTHTFIKSIEHPDFNEPVSITFSGYTPDNNTELEVLISNSNAQSIMVFSHAGEFKRAFTDTLFNDPNCSALMADGSLYIANRLGGSSGRGALDKFGNDETLLFSTYEAGMASLMAVARDRNGDGNDDDTLWVTSGAGDRAIYEYDQNGNLLKTITSADINGGDAITPQGIAFDDNGDFYVVSYGSAVYKFNGNGDYLTKFPVGAGTARSIALRACQGSNSTAGCEPLGLAAAASSASSSTNTNTSSSANPVSQPVVNSSGGATDLISLFLGILCLGGYRHFRAMAKHRP